MSTPVKFPAAPGLATLLTLSDSRLPTGGHVHSGGVEEAVAQGLVNDLATLRAFLRRRVRTNGLVTASISAAHRARFLLKAALERTGFVVTPTAPRFRPVSSSADSAESCHHFVFVFSMTQLRYV